jgi:hypothetical protein
MQLTIAGTGAGRFGPQVFAASGVATAGLSLAARSRLWMPWNFLHFLIP